jgi:AbrB family looped-hinge helix DNA binding protein
MAITTITTKGQVTIPKEIRDYLNVDTGSKVDFVIDENGIVTLIRPGMKSATLEEMETAIKEGSSDWS